MDFFKIGSDVESLYGLGLSYEEPPPATETRTSGRSGSNGRRSARTDERAAAAVAATSPPPPLLPSGEAGLPAGPSLAALSMSVPPPPAIIGRYAALDFGRTALEALDESSETTTERAAYPSVGQLHADRAMSGWGGTDTTTAAAGATSFDGEVELPTESLVHTRNSSLGFTFSGQPADVVRFRSCIPPNVTRVRAGVEAAATPPEPLGPFPADILNVILLFIDVGSAADILEVSRVCRFWRYYANFSPHWTFFRREDWRERGDSLAQYLRAIVARPKVMTREEYFMEKRRVEACQRRDRILDRVKHVRWCVAIAIMAAAMVTANFVVAYTLGFLRTALRSDAKLGATTAVQMTVMTLLEVTVVMIPLGGVSSPSNKDGMIRILSWGLAILDISLVLGIITALAFARVQANGHVLDGPTMDFSMDGECTVYPSNHYPSFALLPALLWDVRWRPLTMDPTANTLQPYCLRKPNDERNESAQCYVVMYFDAHYASDVFHNSTMLRRERDTGTTTALGINPFATGRPIQGTWCSESDAPQMVALTASTYATVAAERNRQFPTESEWLSPAMRPNTLGVISYRCSSTINRETTEAPKGSTDLWYQRSPAWRRYYVPLVTPLRQLRSTFQDTHDHFLSYAFRCYIISACIWGVQLLGQCLVKDAALDVLGATATATLILFNPFSLMVSGTLCVFLDNRDFMCDDGSGYGLIGSGVTLLLIIATVFVVVHD